MTILWGECKQVHVQNMEQLQVHDCPTEPQATEYHTKTTHVYSAGTVCQAYSRLYACCTEAGPAHTAGCVEMVWAHCKKGFVILAIIFLTRIATVDMVLWDNTRIIPCDSQLCNTVHME